MYKSITGEKTSNYQIKTKLYTYRQIYSQSFQIWKIYNKFKCKNFAKQCKVILNLGEWEAACDTFHPEKHHSPIIKIYQGLHTGGNSSEVSFFNVVKIYGTWY